MIPAAHRSLLLSSGVVAWVACGSPDDVSPPLRGEQTLYVVFDERHGLQGGERVVAHEFEIGSVDGVELHQGRVRAALSLKAKDLANLSRATTFTVEELDSGRTLVAHTLAEEAGALEDGDTVDGADSSLELATLRARHAAGELWEEAAESLGELKRELSELDWSEEEETLRQELDEALETLDQSLSKGYEEAAESLESLAKKLEQAGKSEQAERLRRRLRELTRDRDGSGPQG